MAGAFTESTVIGTAGDTINRLDLPEAEKQRLLNQIPVAYAVSYLVGTGFVVWFLSSLAPRLLKVNLKAESRKLEAEMSSAPDVGLRRDIGLQGMGRARLPPAGRRRPGPERGATSRRATPPTGCSSSGSVEATTSSFRSRTPSSTRATSWPWRPAEASLLVEAGLIRRGGPRQGAARLSDGGPRRGAHEPEPRRADARSPGRAARARRGPDEACPRRRGAAVRARHGRQPRRPVAPGRREAGRRARRASCSATSSGRPAKPTSSLSASGSWSAASSASCRSRSAACRSA